MNYDKDKVARQSVYSGDSVRVRIPECEPFPTAVGYGTNVQGLYFNGYPQIVKHEGSQPTYNVKTQKNIMVPMRDGVRIAVDIYRPDAEGEKFPAILAWGMWGKDLQEAVRWLADKPYRPQPYYDSPFWDGTMEAGNFMYTVPRGYAHIIPDPRGVGNSEGYDSTLPFGLSEPPDIYDAIEWIAQQPWCNGKVGMMGPSSYSISQMLVAPLKPPHLVAIHPDESIWGTHEQFHGIYDTLIYHILTGRHGNDSPQPAPNYVYTPMSPLSLGLPDLKERVKEAMNHPDIKYNTKWYSFLTNPRKNPYVFDSLLNSFHPQPLPSNIEDIAIPMYIGTPWVTRLYIWATFEAWENVSTSKEKKKLIVYPPGFPDRPYIQYHDEIVRWYDYWLKGIDTGIMDEPPIKLFVMGINKWRFENEWPLARTKWTRFYLHPKGRLSTRVPGRAKAESFTQPAPYLDPTVYCLRYSVGPLDEDLEITGPVALYLNASIDKDDTNWMADLVDVDAEGNRQWLSVGYLKAKFRATDPGKSKPYRPVHIQQEPVPVHPGEVVNYEIAMMPTSVIFKKGHSIELIIRNQDDILSRLGTWGVYMLPFMQTVTHDIHFGENTYLYLPVIPGKKPE